MADKAFQGDRGQKRLAEELNGGLWFDNKLGVVRVRVDQEQNTLTLTNGTRSEGPMSISAAQSRLSELGDRTSEMRVTDGVDPRGRPEFPSNTAGIQALIKALDNEVQERDQLTSIHDEVKAEFDDLSGKASWRETMLWGLFGDKSLRGNLKLAEKQLGVAAAGLEKEGTDIGAAQARINEAVARHLSKEKPEFAALRARLDSANGLSRAARTFLGSIRTAIRETNEAVSAKKSDAFTDGLSALSDNPALQVLDRIDDFTSSMEVSEAQTALRALSGKAEAYEAAAAAYKEFSVGQVGASAGAAVDGSISFEMADFVLDTIFDFDVFGAFSACSQASDLSEISDKLAKPRRSMEGVVSNIKEVIQGLEAEIDAQVAAHREAIKTREHGYAPPTADDSKMPQLRV